MRDKEKDIYIKNCQDAYTSLHEVANYFLNIDTKGRSWNMLTYDEQEKIINTIHTWDHEEFYKLYLETNKNLIEISEGIIY